jgi:hypothetical protein
MPVKDEALKGPPLKHKIGARLVDIGAAVVLLFQLPFMLIAAWWLDRWRRK